MSRQLLVNISVIKESAQASSGQSSQVSGELAEEMSSVPRTITNGNYQRTNPLSLDERKSLLRDSNQRNANEEVTYNTEVKDYAANSWVRKEAFRSSSSANVPINIPSTDSSSPIVQDLRRISSRGQVSCAANTNNVAQCMVCNCMHEAASEGHSGMVAVNRVAYTRMVRANFPNTMCGVIWQPKQFSWTHQSNRFSSKKTNTVRRCARASYDALKLGPWEYDHYYANKGPNRINPPRWALRFASYTGNTMQVNRHIFIDSGERAIASPYLANYVQPAQSQSRAARGTF